MRTGDPAEQSSPRNAAREVILCLWFIVIGAAFWGTYAGVFLAAPLTPFYGLFLAASVVLLALRFLRGDGGAAAGADQSEPVERLARARAARKKTERRG